MINAEQQSKTDNDVKKSVFCTEMTKNLVFLCLHFNQLGVLKDTSCFTNEMYFKCNRVYDEIKWSMYYFSDK